MVKKFVKRAWLSEKKELYPCGSIYKFNVGAIAQGGGDPEFIACRHLDRVKEARTLLDLLHNGWCDFLSQGCTVSDCLII